MQGEVGKHSGESEAYTNLAGGQKGPVWAWERQGKPDARDGVAGPRACQLVPSCQTAMSGYSAEVMLGLTRIRVKGKETLACGAG